MISANTHIFALALIAVAGPLVGPATQAHAQEQFSLRQLGGLNSVLPPGLIPILTSGDSAQSNGSACCFADCDQSTGVGVPGTYDILWLQSAFDHANPYACDCDMTTGASNCGVFVFLCCGYAFVAGCP